LIEERKGEGRDEGTNVWGSLNQRAVRIQQKGKRLSTDGYKYARLFREAGEKEPLNLRENGDQKERNHNSYNKKKAPHGKLLRSRNYI